MPSDASADNPPGMQRCSDRDRQPTPVLQTHSFSPTTPGLRHPLANNIPASSLAIATSTLMDSDEIVAVPHRAVEVEGDRDVQT